MSIPLDHPHAAEVWDPVPGPQNLGGIWGWGGVSVDPADGSIFTAVGNSQYLVGGVRVLRRRRRLRRPHRSPDGRPDLGPRLPVASPFLATGDYDFGAAPLLFQPKGCPPLAAANNKIGSLFIWNRRDLAAGPIASIPLGDGLSAFIGTPAWSAARQTIYAAQAVLFGDGGRLGNGVRAFQVVAGCRFESTWAQPVGDGNQAQPLVVGDVVFATGGRPGGFYALDARNGARLWSASTAGRTVAATITVGGSVFGADASGTVYTFRPAPTLPRGKRPQ